MERAIPSATALSPQLQLTGVVLDYLWPRLDWHVANGAVLHVGCAAGDVTTQQLLPRLPQEALVVAADRNPSAVEQAASRFAGPRLRFLALHVGTRRIHNTHVWRLGPYSKVFCFFSLQWEQHQRRAIKNISKLLCPGGETVIVMINRRGLFETFESLANSAKWNRYLKDCQQLTSPPQFSDKPDDELRSYLEEAGLVVKSCYEQEIIYVTKEEFRFRETMMALNPFLNTFPQDMQEAFQRESEEAAFQNGLVTASKTKSDTLYSVKYHALIAHALKTGIV